MNTLVHTSSTQAANRLAIARVAAGGRTTDTARQVRAMHDAAREQGQMYYADGDWCMICRRPTDHLGEHSPEQVDAWKAGER